MKTKKTVIYVGYTCNNNCIFCYNSNRRQYIQDESTAIIKQKILNAKQEGSTYLELIGGEPTIRKDIFKIVRFAKKLKFNTIMFATNGRMFANKEFAKRIIDAGLNHIVFSIHGSTAKTHDFLTKVPNSFDDLKKGINNIKEIGFKDIGTNTAIVKQNYKDLLNIGRFIYNLGIQNSEFIFVDPTNWTTKSNFADIVPQYETVSPYVHKLLKFGKENKIQHWHIRYYPLCFIAPEYHDMVSEIHENKHFNTEHLAPDFINRNVVKNRKEIGRIKIEKCKTCKYENKCEGYWKEYVKFYELS